MKKVASLASGASSLWFTWLNPLASKENWFFPPFKQSALPTLCSMPPADDLLVISAGTLYGQRKGHVFLAIQDDPKCFPLFILELATPTTSLVKEMASGLVRIALECEKAPAGEGKLLLQESTWTMFCNGRKRGYASRREFTEIDRHILNLVQAVSMGAGVLPMVNGFEGELMYMRAQFDRVIASGDSESFYMMNPDGSEGPELSIFLMRKDSSSL